MSTLSREVHTSGNYDDGWTEGTTTSDKFWILSHTEVFGNNTDNGNAWVPSYFYKEGTQYAWFKSKGVNAKSEGYSANTAIADIDKTRAGDTTTGGGSSYWWLRSPDLLVPISFAIVNTMSSYGFPTADSAERAHGVVPCFAF